MQEIDDLTAKLEDFKLSPNFDPLIFNKLLQDEINKVLGRCIHKDTDDVIEEVIAEISNLLEHFNMKKK